MENSSRLNDVSKATRFLGVLPPIFIFLLMSDSGIGWQFRSSHWFYLIDTLYAPLAIIFWSFLPIRFSARTIKWLRYAILLQSITLLFWVLPFIAKDVLKHLAHELTQILFWTSGCFVVIGIPALLLIPWPKASEITVQNFAKVVRVTTCIILFCSLVIIGVVIGQAERIASGQSYCLLTPTYSSFWVYRKPSVFELSAWEMRGHLAWSIGELIDAMDQQPAILAVQDGNGFKVKVWSYSSLNFVEEEYGWDLVNRYMHESTSQGFIGRRMEKCDPKPHYALHLKLWPGDIDPAI